MVRSTALHPAAVGRSGPLDDEPWVFAGREAEILNFTVAIGPHVGEAEPFEINEMATRLFAVAARLLGEAPHQGPNLGPARQTRRANHCRVSLRESPFFRGAKGNYSGQPSRGSCKLARRGEKILSTINDIALGR